MLRRLDILRAFLILGMSLVFTTGQGVVRAQDLVGGANRTDLSGGASESGSGTRAPKRPKVRNSGTTSVRKVERPRTVVVRPTTRTLSVATNPGAAILVEPVNGGEALEAQLEKDERLFVFADVKPGNYRVAAELDGYKEREVNVIVPRDKPASVTLDLQPIMDNVTVEANITSGEIRYASVVGARDVNGDIKYNQVGEVKVVQIQNGRALLPNLRPGTYGMDVRANEVGYQTLLGRFTLPGKTTLNVALNKVLSTKTFSALWASLDAWDAPAGWRVGSRKLSTGGRGVALPKDESSRYYSYFRLHSNVRMVNGVAASYAIRAKDNLNYYLIQLTGGNAAEQYVMRGFVVKNGVSQSFGIVPIDAYTSTLKQGQFFKLTMEAQGNKFKVWITDSETGQEFPLGDLVDPNNNYPIGAVGIAVRDNEQSEYESFIVCTDESPDCKRG